MTKRLALFATHPVQYHVPIWRGLAKTPGLEVTVYYFSNHSIRGTVDAGFDVPVAWDVPLLEGYEHEFISRTADLARPNSVGVPNAGRVLRDGRYDCVLLLGYMHRFERQVIRAARRLGIRTVMRGEFADIGRHRGLVRRLVRGQYLKWFYSHVDAFCYIGEEARRHLLERGIPEEKLFFSPYSVDSTLFEAQRRMYDRGERRADLGLTEDCFTFLFSGKLIPRKDPLILLEALRRLHRHEQVALIVLGDGPLKTQVVKLGSDLLGSRFLFRGFVNQSQLGQYFLAADAFVLPSNVETWGLVVNEAMHFGLPVIVSDQVGCHRDLVIEGKTGLIFQSGDAQALSFALQHLMQDTAEAKRMGRNAQQHIRLYSTEASVAGIMRAIGLQNDKCAA